MSITVDSIQFFVQNRHSVSIRKQQNRFRSGSLQPRWRSWQRFFRSADRLGSSAIQRSRFPSSRRLWRFGQGRT